MFDKLVISIVYYIWEWIYLKHSTKILYDYAEYEGVDSNVSQLVTLINFKCF